MKERIAAQSLSVQKKPKLSPGRNGEIHLHIGGVRNALFNWLFARHHGGQFILRTDDTDVRIASRAIGDLR